MMFKTGVDLHVHNVNAKSKDKAPEANITNNLRTMLSTSRSIQPSCINEGKICMNYKYMSSPRGKNQCARVIKEDHPNNRHC